MTFARSLKMPGETFASISPRKEGSGLQWSMFLKKWSCVAILILILDPGLAHSQMHRTSPTPYTSSTTLRAG